MKNKQKIGVVLMLILLVSIIPFQTEAYSPITIPLEYEVSGEIQSEDQEEDKDIQKILLDRKKQDEKNAFFIDIGELKIFTKNENGNFIQTNYPFTQAEIESYNDPLVEIKYLGTEEKAQSCDRFDLDIGWNYFSRQKYNVFYPAVEQDINEPQRVSVSSVKALQVPVQANNVQIVQQDTDADGMVTVQIDPAITAKVMPQAALTSIISADEVESVEALADVSATGITAVQVAPQDAQWIQSLYTLASEIGGEGYILFVQETQNQQALYTLLKGKKHVSSFADFDAFKKLNNIDDAYIQRFNAQYQEARENLARAQVNAYASFLLLQSGETAEAEQHYIVAKRHFDAYRDWISIVQSQITSWKPLEKIDVQAASFVSFIDGEKQSRCLTENDLGLEIWYYGNENGKAKVAFNTEYFNQKRSYGIPSQDSVQDEQDNNVFNERKQDSVVECTVNGKRVPLGARFIGEQDGKEIPMYCDKVTKVALPQKKIGALAENAEECLTGVQGYDSEQGKGVCKEETVSLLKRILGFFGIL